MSQVIVGCLKFAGYVNYCKDLDNFCLDCIHTKQPGFDFEIILFMLQYLTNSIKKSEFKISMKQYYVFGSLLNASDPDGDLDGLLGALKHGTIDIAIPDFYVTEFRSRIIDYLMPVVHSTRSAFLVHPFHTNKVFVPKFFQVFGLSIWIAGIASWLLASIGLTILTSTPSNNKSKIDETRRPLTNFIDGFYDIPFMKRASYKWLGFPKKILITVWSLAALVGLHCFGAVYVKSLTPETDQKPPFTNFAQLAQLMHQKKYTMIITQKGAYHNFMQPESQNKAFEVLRNVATPENVLFLNDPKLGMQRTSEKPGSAYVMNDGNIGMALKGQTHLIGIPVTDPSQVHMTTYAVSKRSKYFTQLRDAYFIARELGITTKLYNKYGAFQNRNEKGTIHGYLELKPLDLSQISDAFYILCVCFGFCVLVFIFEIFI